jgi:peptidoglycan/LPS O-acetylase OafA/YrhL
MISTHFVVHYQNQNQITSAYAHDSLLYIMIIIVSMILLSLRKHNKDANMQYTSPETTNALRGLAIVLLIIGHLCIMCMEGEQFFEYAGAWAVIIFLLISGFAITVRYGLNDIERTFIKQRIKRLLFAVWITLALFYSLEFILFNKVYSTQKIILSFAGIINIFPPNGPAWFITYIMFLYALFYFTSKLRTTPFKKNLFILFISYLTAYVIVRVSLLDEYFHIWIRYTIVFPLGVFWGLYKEKIYSYLHVIYQYSRIAFMGLLIAFYASYYNFFSPQNPLGAMILPQSTMLKLFIETLQPVLLVIPIIMIGFVLDMTKRVSHFLTVLGSHSFEIYLLHFPFMAYYDFFLFRKPLTLYFFLYAAFIFTLSLLLKKTTTFLNKRVLVRTSSYALHEPL